MKQQFAQCGMGSAERVHARKVADGLTSTGDGYDADIHNVAVDSLRMSLTIEVPT